MRKHPGALRIITWEHRKYRDCYMRRANIDITISINAPDAYHKPTPLQPFLRNTVMADLANHRRNIVAWIEWDVIGTRLDQLVRYAHER